MKQSTRAAILLFVVGTLLFSAKAQSSFSLGIKAGVNFSNYISESNLEPGADAGIFFRIGRTVFFQPEVLYSFRTSSFNEMVDEVRQNIDIQEHYIDIPLFFLGPRVGLRVGSDYNDIDSLLGYAQWGGRAGLGIDFWRFTLDLSYDISASKFKKPNADDFWKQNLISASLGFKIIK